MAELEETDVEDILKTVYDVYDYDLTEYSKASLLRRISRFLQVKKIDSIEELKINLTGNEAFFAQFLEDITVNVTEMFRDPLFFKALRVKVVPELRTYPYVKIWDAGCSTGEEAYSIAIILKEEGVYDNSTIYGTDINQSVLKKAKDGIFPLSQMQNYTKNYILSGGKQEFSDYYLAKYDRALFSGELKKNLVFAAHNLVSDGSFNEFNMIVCRNVLIYFNRELQDKVIRLFRDSLCNFGYLALGNKETLALSKYRKNFEVVDREEKIYRKIS